MSGLQPAPGRGHGFVKRSIGIAGIVLTASALGLLLLSHRPASRKPATLCSGTDGREAATRVAPGPYDVMLEEWGSTAPLCLHTDGGPDFRVTRSAIGQDTVGAYPNISTVLRHDGLPVRISRMGAPASSWQVRTPGTTGSFDVMYDITIGQYRTSTSWAGGAEVMIWLTTRGHPYPLGRIVATHALIDGAAYTVWVAHPPTNSDQIIVTFIRERPTLAVRGLRLGRFIRLAAAYGSFPTSYYLVRVQAGIEIIRGGQGFATTSFSYRPSPRRHR